MANASPRDRLKIEKLLRLSSSPNPHEAQRAKEEAERQMSKLGLTYADFQKDEVVSVEASEDCVDVNLARAVGISRRCSAAVNRRGQLAFCGRGAAPHKAKALYLYLIGEVSKHCEIGPNDPGRSVWRRYYWGGFIHSVKHRLQQAEVEVWTPPPVVVDESGAERVHVADESAERQVEQKALARKELIDFANLLQSEHGTHVFCKQAYEAGIAFGKQVPIPTDDEAEKRTDRMLSEKEST